MGAPDYKAMYYHLAGRMATAVEVMDATVATMKATVEALDSTTKALANVTEKLKMAQQTTEEMFIGSGEDGSQENSE